MIILTSLGIYKFLLKEFCEIFEKVSDYFNKIFAKYQYIEGIPGVIYYRFIVSLASDYKFMN